MNFVVLCDPNLRPPVFGLLFRHLQKNDNFHSHSCVFFAIFCKKRVLSTWHVFLKLRSINIYMKTSSLLSAASIERDLGCCTPSDTSTCHQVPSYGRCQLHKEGSLLTDWDSADGSMSVTKEDVILPLNAGEHCECHMSL